MIFNDTTNRQGIIQDCEDTCGLGSTGITADTALFQQFVRWCNNWAKKGAAIAIMAMDGWDFDDPAWTTYPSGTYTGTTDRDYVIAGTLKMLKIKKVAIDYNGDGNYVDADPIDTDELAKVRKSGDVDNYYTTSDPKFDSIGNAIFVFPKFTQAQVDAGAKVYIEFYREPKEFATSGTDSQEPGFASPFHNLISRGASLEYCQLYRPDLVPALRAELYGSANDPGILRNMEDWYNTRYPRRKSITPLYEDNK